MYTEDVAKKANQICKEVVDVLAQYDGVQLDLRQSDVSVDKSLVVHFFKVSWSIYYAVAHPTTIFQYLIYECNKLY